MRLADLPRLKRLARAAERHHPRLLAGVRRARKAFEFHLDKYTGRDMLPLLVQAMHARLQRSSWLGGTAAASASANAAREPSAAFNESSAVPPSGEPPPTWTTVEPLANSVEARGRYTTRWAVPELDGSSTPSWRRPVLWQRVGRFIQNLSYNRPGGDATFRHAAVGWRCRTAPSNFDARECVCQRTQRDL